MVLRQHKQPDQQQAQANIQRALGNGGKGLLEKAVDGIGNL